MLDEDTISQNRALLATHRRTLAHLLEQAATYGGIVLAPPQTAAGIKEARANIRTIKATLREHGIPVEDDLNDAATSQAATTHSSEDDYAEGNTGATQTRTLQLVVAAFTGVVTSIVMVSSGIGIYNVLDISFKSYFWLLWPLILVFAGLALGVLISSRRTDQEPELVLTQERKEEIRIFGLPVWSVVHYEKGRRDWCILGIPIWSFAINHVAIPIVTVAGIATGLLAGSFILFAYSANDPSLEVSQMPEPSPTLTRISTSTSFPTPSMPLPTLTITITPSSIPTERPVPTQNSTIPPALPTPDTTSPPVTATPSLPTSMPTLLVPTERPVRTATPSPTTIITDGLVTYTVNITRTSLDEFRTLPGCHDIGTGVDNRPNNGCVVGPSGLGMEIVNINDPSTLVAKWSFTSDARQVYLHWDDRIRINVNSDGVSKRITTIGNNEIRVVRDVNYKIEVSKVTSP